MRFVKCNIICGHVARKYLTAGLTLCLCLPVLSQSFINREGKTIEARFITPAGYSRTIVSKTSYTAYLRNLQLFPDGYPVRYYDGSLKPNNEVHAAVVSGIDVDIEGLQQDPETCIRIWGEYLFEQREYDKIAFTISNREQISYVNWVEGLKFVIDGKPYWTKQPTDADRYRTFRRYLDFIFTHANIETLLNDVQKITFDDIAPGDMFIQPAHQGHAVVVVDVAVNGKTGDRVFLLAQSHKPAQSFHVLLNPMDANLSPWYSVSAIDDKIVTPEFIFYKRDLYRFRESSGTTVKKKSPLFYF